MLGRVASSLLLRGDLLLFFARVEDVEDVETGFGGGLDLGTGMGWGDGGRGLRVNVAGKVAEEGEADVDDYYVKVR